MKILFIANYGDLYGANRSLLSVIKYFKENGSQVLVFVPSKGGMSIALAHLEVETCVIPFFSSFLYVKYKLKYLLWPLLLIFNSFSFIYILIIAWCFKPSLIYSNTLAKNKVAFIHHPVDNNLFTKSVVQVTQNDIFIWGAIEPYKGILEFVQYLVDKQASLRVKIIGKCKNDNFRNQINAVIENFHSISFEDRRISRDELKLLVHKSSYVVFPYLSNSVSSSGALMDTLAMGGNVIGPNKGAFKDLGVECLCFTFNTYDDIIRHVESNSKVDSGRIHQFVKENNWSAFVNNVFEIIIAL